MKKLARLLLAITCIGCAKVEKPVDNFGSSSVPEWSKNVVWYQIFPERFRNGDLTNDPSPEDMQMTFPERIPDTWEVSPWGGDWYNEDAWMSDIDGMDFSGKLQLRRYGGDLQGVLDKLDYLEELGVTGIYFNPLNDAPSLHKYDPRNWRHVDRNFGPDPSGDVEMMNLETPIDPSTWTWTSADKMFLKVIEELHARGIKVIMDYSWNHTGYDFWAVNDIRKKGEASEFTEWYEVERFDDPNTSADETLISGWWGFKYLPLIKENVIDENARLPHEGNVASQTFKQHVYNVSKRWLDPNGDGDFSDGVDGFRMDVASEMTQGWWRDYRTFVKSVNPDALLVAEVWWFDWPDLTGPEKMMQGDQFDALMNYRWFVLSSGLFKQANPKLKPSEFVIWYDSLNVAINTNNQHAMMNVAATHDTPRLSTSLFNANRFDQGSKLSENGLYKAHRPDSATWMLLRTYLLHQFSFVGSPHIWNGDELGMWGANDPDERKPIWWEDIQFENESSNPYSGESFESYAVSPDKDLLSYYKQLIRMRLENPALAYGDIDYFLIDDERMLFGYSRIWEEHRVYVVFNLMNTNQEVVLEKGRYVDLLSGEEYGKNGEKVVIELQGKCGRIFSKVVD